MSLHSLFSRGRTKHTRLNQKLKLGSFVTLVKVVQYTIGIITFNIFPNGFKDLLSFGQMQDNSLNEGV